VVSNKSNKGECPHKTRAPHLKKHPACVYTLYLSLNVITNCFSTRDWSRKKSTPITEMGCCQSRSNTRRHHHHHSSRHRHRHRNKASQGELGPVGDDPYGERQQHTPEHANCRRRSAHSRGEEMGTWPVFEKFSDAVDPLVEETSIKAPSPLSINCVHRRRR
jgi:hypothetical protein